MREIDFGIFVLPPFPPLQEIPSEVQSMFDELAAREAGQEWG